MSLLLVADGGTDSDETPGRVNGPRCPWMVDNTRVRQFFRLLALLNLVVLLLSVPFSTVHCTGGNDTLDGDSPSNLVQLWVITSLDTVLALLFTVQFALRLRYFLAMKRPLKVLARVATRILGPLFSIFSYYLYFLLLFGGQNCLYVDNQQRHFARHWDYIRLCNVFCVTFALWWSVGVGVSVLFLQSLLWRLKLFLSPHRFMKLSRDCVRESISIFIGWPFCVPSPSSRRSSFSSCSATQTSRL